MSNLRYHEGAALPALKLWVLDDDGTLIDFSTGWTFNYFKIGHKGAAAVLTKTTGLTGAAGAGVEPTGTPNVTVAWASGDLSITPAVYGWDMKCTKDGLPRFFSGSIEISETID
jgi:hypothetical protein